MNYDRRTKTADQFDEQIDRAIKHLRSQAKELEKKADEAERAHRRGDMNALARLGIISRRDVQRMFDDDL